MRSKRPLLYLAAGVVCAAVAMLVASRVMASKGIATSAPVEGVEILLAMRDIEFGELLVLEGAGEGGNVKFIGPWPKDLLPEGAFAGQKKATFTSGKFRATFPFVKHMPIMERLMASEETFVPADMVRAMIKVSTADISSGRFRPGMKVDVLRIVDKRPVDFIRSVQIYAIGKLDAEGKPSKVKEKEVEPNVFFLIKKADLRAFIEAQGASQLLLVEAAEPLAEGPVLVEGILSDAAKKQAAEDRLKRGRELMASGDYETAAAVYEEVLHDYGDVDAVKKEAPGQLVQSRKAAAQALYDKARTAFERDRDYAAALGHLDKLEADYTMLSGKDAPPAADLRQTIRAERDKQVRQREYAQLIDNLAATLKSGNVPQAEKLLGDLNAFAGAVIEAKEGYPEPARAIADWQGKVSSARSGFQVEESVLRALLTRGDVAQAQERLQDIKKKYPAHPSLPQLEEAVSSAVKKAPTTGS